MSEKKVLTKKEVIDYFLSKPGMSSGPTAGQLQMCGEWDSEEGEGLVEIVDVRKNYVIVTVYWDGPARMKDHIHEALEWCLGADQYSVWRQMFNPDGKVITVKQPSEEDLQRFYEFALVYFKILNDEDYKRIDSQMDELRSKLRENMLLLIPHFSNIR